MIQAFGLTSNPRKAHPPAVDDVSFEARSGQVTALLGGAGAGKTTALRLMLELQQGRGITYFRGRPLHRIAHPSREVGVLLGDVPGHPARSVRGHMRMLCAASGVPARRADEVLEVVGLVSFREERLGTLSRGMDLRVGLACALLPDPHTLVLDEPAAGLSTREVQWLHGMLRAHAQHGGTVVFTTADPKEAARTADRVVTLDGGRLVADQDAGEFARTRLRPRVAVRSPHAARLAALLTKEARTGRCSVEVVREDGNRLSVYGSTTADIGETAFRHGILVHQLADEMGDMGPGVGAGPGSSSGEEGEVATDEARVVCAHDTSGAVAAQSDTRVPGLPTVEPGSTAYGSSGAASDAGSSAFGSPVAEPVSPVAGSPVPEKTTVAFGFSSAEPSSAASGVPAGERGATPAGLSAERQERAAVDAAAPEPGVAGLSSDEGARAVSALVSVERPQSAGGEWSSLGDAANPGAAEYPQAAPAARLGGGSPGSALPEAGGAAHGVVASGDEDVPIGGEEAGPAETPARADGGRIIDATGADTTQGALVAAQEARTVSTSTPAAAFSALRSWLPGARTPCTHQPRTDRTDRSYDARTLDALSPLPPPIS
ncbi:ABC transporter ATP-binding protein, partial [Streptomyces sp. MMG1121]|uniref:ABC transporter ATP-binding protein n=1 Tax=Streptomyces sp. MMG1121 TaxID=1415544 RepID=UPI001F226FE3